MKKSILGIFEEESTLISALKKIKEEDIEVAEVYTPYPIHEVFKILNMKTRLKVASFIFATLGLVLSYLFIYWTSVISYPLIYGGKPYHSIPSFIIICFVTTICVAILLSVITFFVRTRLYPGKKPVVMDSRITDHAFVILINADNEESSHEIKGIFSLLKENGAVEVLER